MEIIFFLFKNFHTWFFSGEFSKERERVENRGNYLKMKEEKILNTSVNNYMQWIQVGEDLIEKWPKVFSGIEHLGALTRVLIVSKQLWLKHYLKFLHATNYESVNFNY
jgi:hypothetical protein